MQRSRSRSGRTEAYEAERHTQAVRRQTPGAGAAVPAPLTADALRAVQRTAGNAIAAGMIARRARTEEAPEAPGTDVHQVLGSAGKPLAGPVRQEMEARLGADFSDVRLHTGATARSSAAGIGARAYTSGSHIVIGEGGGDRHTLAHELTHVVQQRTGPVAGTDDGNGLRVSDPSDRFEREAEANASRVLSQPLSQAPAEDHPAQPPRHRAAEPSVQRRPQPKPAEEEGDHTHVDPDYPGLRLILDREKSAKTNETIFQLSGTEQRVIFDEGGDFGYIKADDDLSMYYSLGEIGADKAQADLTGHFTPQRDTIYNVKANGQAFHEAWIDSLQDFEAYGVSSDQLVEVSVALLQEASGRADTVAGGLDEVKFNNAASGVRNSAALDPIKIKVSGSGISIKDGNHRLAAAARLGYAYVPCKLV
ncbi:DUF4157 domain-containing protein [Streptomyces sp. DG2A-72]|uniref:eCIS core domain-containing protein n=1 Tax=Streptomyces sp. DG2A-72 TaxID=3051386 RepID=UPI00265BCBD8|nr:DUF4157 domain-containing protein [Streptomyces sp. DG2A-72]MDO0934852.1 DUF4157 domain-containing protein [Streptomyces sp. DG2A-72]